MSASLNDPFEVFLYRHLADYQTHLHLAPGVRLSQAIWLEQVKRAHEAWHAARKRKAKPKAPPSTEVEALYLLYPRKVGKPAALRAIAKALEKAPDYVLKARVQAYAAATAKWPKSDRHFIPHPSTWFNEERWNDEAGEWERAGGTDNAKDTEQIVGEPTAWLLWMRAHRPDWARFREEKDGYPVPVWEKLRPDERTTIVRQMEIET